MTLTPILEASTIIQLHLLAALPALVLGPVILWGRQRRHMHRWLGYLWVSAMLLLAGTGLLIPSQGLALVGPFGPIHLLSLVTFAGIAQGIWYARQRRVTAHRRAMQALWFWALGLAGLFTLLPGRIMNETLLAGSAWAGWLVIVLGLGVIMLTRRLGPRPFRRGDFTG